MFVCVHQDTSWVEAVVQVAWISHDSWTDGHIPGSRILEWEPETTIEARKCEELPFLGKNKDLF